MAFPLRADATRSLVDPEDEAELEALLRSTNPVERHRSGEIRIVSSEDDYVGGNREFVLWPFAHPAPSRFSDGSFGVLYCAENRQTAIQEASHRLDRIYSDGAAPKQDMRKQHLSLRLVADEYADVRASVVPGIDRRIYHSDDYSASQACGKKIRQVLPGLTYDSVRHMNGVCTGAFVPRICSDVRLLELIDFAWDGTRFVETKTVSEL
jgi:hypothetical protein